MQNTSSSGPEPNSSMGQAGGNSLTGADASSAFPLLASRLNTNLPITSINSSSSSTNNTSTMFGALSPTAEIPFEHISASESLQLLSLLNTNALSNRSALNSNQSLLYGMMNNVLNNSHMSNISPGASLLASNSNMPVSTNGPVDQPVDLTLRSRSVSVSSSCCGSNSLTNKSGPSNNNNNNINIDDDDLEDSTSAMNLSPTTSDLEGHDTSTVPSPLK